MIYIVKHNNESFVPLNKGYTILGVGNEFIDDGRDNINHLNLYINETTALYDIWKNCNENIVGLNHYRRSFIFVDEQGFLFNMSFKTAKTIVEDNKLICTNKINLKENTIYSHLKYAFQTFCPNVVSTFDKYINKLEKIDKDLVNYFKTSHGLIAKNMFICKKEIIDKYCEYLFPFIIPLTEEFINYDLKNIKALGNYPGQERMMGHIIERIFSYWLEEKLGIDNIVECCYITHVE